MQLPEFYRDFGQLKHTVSSFILILVSHVSHL